MVVVLIRSITIMDNISVTKNEYCIYNDTVYMLIAREARVSMLDWYTKVLEVETKFGGVFYIPYKEYSGNLNINFKNNIYLDLKTGNPTFAGVDEDNIYKNISDIDFKRMYNDVYLNGSLPVFLMSKYKYDCGFRNYVDYLDSLFCDTYKGTIDNFIGKGITGLFTNAPTIFVGSRVTLCNEDGKAYKNADRDNYFIVESINGVEFKVLGDDNIYSICDVCSVDNSDFFINVITENFNFN